MFQSVTSFFTKSSASNKPAPVREQTSRPAAGGRRGPGSDKQTYSRVFRWKLPEGETKVPQSVEIVGSFTHWKRVPLERDPRQSAWQGTINNIPGGRTHHYMLLLDGKPTFDKACDGYAIPHGEHELFYQLQTEKGGRVLMLFAQAK
jgi:hypothetical protein